MSEFRKAIHAVGEPVTSAWQAGKQALAKGHKDLVVSADKNEKRWIGSIELDEALKPHPDHAQANRWDYGLGYTAAQGNECALWIEVHSAHTSEVSCVIKKVKWLRDFLEQDACAALKKLTHATPAQYRYVWVASSGNHILPGSKQLRALRQAGMDPPTKQFRLP